jgi:hypothetical protein
LVAKSSDVLVFHLIVLAVLLAAIALAVVVFWRMLRDDRP